MIYCDPCHMAFLKTTPHPEGARPFWDTGPFSFYCDCSCHTKGPDADSNLSRIMTPPLVMP